MPYYTLPLESGPIQVNVEEPSRFIGWCNDWARIYDLKAAGYVTTRDGGPGTYGHTDFYLTPGWKPDSEPEAVRLFEPAPTQMPGQLTR